MGSWHAAQRSRVVAGRMARRIRTASTAAPPPRSRRAAAAWPERQNSLQCRAAVVISDVDALSAPRSVCVPTLGLRGDER